MQKRTVRFSQATTDYYFSSGLSALKKLADRRRTIIITDENVYRLHSKKFRDWDCIVLKAGEEYKIQSTVDAIIEQLIKMETDREALLVGAGGGVVTDITGYTAAIYMRGIKCGFVPTTLLSMVDASIGGKNGVDVGSYKNMAGTIRQPSFIIHDLSFLETLPPIEWSNGFAEIIKHASIADASLFKMLEKNHPGTLAVNRKLLDQLIVKNALFKTRLVIRDEFEKGPRRILNFGHTLGHALEKLYELSHGQAISIGMAYAAYISEKVTGFNEARRVVGLLKQYGLPSQASFNKQKVFEVLKMDKKRTRKEINFILLNRIGQAVVQPVPLKKLEQIIDKLLM